MTFPPSWQAPTGSIAGPDLCFAVTLAGGLGAMGFTWTSPESIAEAVTSVRQAVGERLFQGNFALAFPPLGLDAALDTGLPIVTFSWGDCRPYIRRCQLAGARVGTQVTNRQGAIMARDAGVDFLVVQGIEAGGHVQSTTPLAELLHTLRDLGLHIVAAGGIASGRDIAEVLEAGANAAMLGTRFVATQESLAHPEYKRLLVESDQTALTQLFDGGWPFALHRVLRNSTFEAWEAAGCPAPGVRPGEGEILGSTENGPILRYDDVAPRDGFSGQIEGMCLYAGTSVKAIHDVPSAAEVVARLATEAGLTLSAA